MQPKRVQPIYVGRNCWTVWNKANYVIFSEHMLSEFEGDAGHYLKFGKKDIEATAEEPSHEAHAAPAPSPAGNNAGTIATSMAAVAVAIAATLFR